MKAEILSIGTELLMGGIVNTNAQYIAQKLTEVGIDHYYEATVGDNNARLCEAVRDALKRADIVIMSGGLGPTADDLTKETASEALGFELVLDEASLEYIKERFRKMGREMTPNNVKQAMFPKGCIIMPNPNGTAPGCIIERDGKAAILLPGPPKEMRPMFDASVMPYLMSRSGHKLYSRTLRIFGMGESKVEYTLKDIMDTQTNPTIAPYALSGETTLRVTAACKNDAEGEKLVMPMIAKVRDRLGDVIYSDEGKSLNEVCAALMLNSGKTIAAAESCTGGMLSSMLVDVPKSSHWFVEGVTTYSNESKVKRLGVSQETIDKFGAVSEQTAREMAIGVRKCLNANIGIATTGIAGPDGGSEEKPVGLVYVALSIGDNVEVKELHITGSRERVRYSTCLNALDMLRRSFR